MVSSGEESNQFFKNTYDSLGRIVVQEDGNKHTTTFTHDESEYGLITTKTTQPGINGQIITDKYNTNFQLLEHFAVPKAQSGADPDVRTRYAYTEQGMLRRTYVEPKGNASIQTDYEYDAVSGKETKVTLFDYPSIGTNTSTQKSYYDNGNLKNEKDELNVIVNYEYHPNNMLKSVTHVQDGKNLLTEYRLSDPNSANPVTETIISPRGRQTGKQTQQKYEKGRLIEVIDPEGNRVSYTYDAVGNKKQEIHYDKNSVEVSRVSYDYDNLGRVVSTTDAEGKVIYTQWSIHGEERILTDANSRQTVFEYDSNSNVKSKKDTLNNVTQFEYDENDHLIMETDAENRKRHYLHNDKGLLVTEFRHGNSRFTDAIVSYEYDVFGHVNKVYKHRNGAFNDKALLEEYEYDKRGHKTKITSYQGDKARTTKYDLSVKGQVLFFTDPKANKTGFNYYDSGEIKSVTDAENGIAGQQFDADGNRIALTDPKQNTTTFDHDANKKQTLENPQGGVKPFTREYNALGLLAKRTNGREQAESYTYYKNGWLRTVTVDGKIYTYAYDNNGNVLRVDGSDNSAIVRTYDVLNRVKTYSTLGSTIAYDYDKVGNLTGLTYPGGKKVTYAYNNDNRLETVTDWLNRQLVRYEYTTDGRLLKEIRNNGTVREYVYGYAGTTNQGVGELTAILENNAKGEVIVSYAFAYDLNGNITKETVSPEPTLDQLKIPAVSMRYTADNRLETYNKQAVTYDNDGNMTSGPLGSGFGAFSYDARNRLIQAGATKYAYTVEDHRVKVEQDGKVTQYVVNPHAKLSQTLIKQDPDGKETFYIYGLGLIAQVQMSSNATHFYHYDLRGSTVAMTDSTGQLPIASPTSPTAKYHAS